MKIDTKIARSIDRNVSELWELASDLSSAKRKALLRPAARKLVAKIQANAPTETGNLAESFKILPLKKTSNLLVGPERLKKLGKRKYAKGNAYVGGWYAGFQEFGTQKMRGKHFVEETLNEVGDEIAADIKKATERLIRRRIKKLNAGG